MGTRRIVVHLRLPAGPEARRHVTACGLPVTMRRRSTVQHVAVNCTACLAAATTRAPHERDEECDVDPATDLCRGCHVHHGDPCPACGGRGYHRAACPELLPPVLVELLPAGSGVEAVLHGRSSRVLRPVPGNTRPASAAWWPSRELALAELASMLGRPVREVCR